MQAQFVKKVINILGDARLVGGCVRDAILKKPIKDVDVATSKTPDEVTKLLEAAGIKVIPTGIKHGTVTAVQNKSTIEITTLRRDVECYGRHAEVEFTDDWKEDAARRDFTFNSLSMDLEGNIYDYFGGIADLHRGMVKFVGDPEARVQEDYLRILRYFRFETYYAHGTHTKHTPSLAACIKFADKLEELSGERIQSEMLKLLRAEDPFHVLMLMREEGVLQHIIPGSTQYVDLEAIQHMVQIEHEEGSVMPSQDAIIRLALLFEAGRKQVQELCSRWKCSNAHREQLLELVEPEDSVIIDHSHDEDAQKRILVRIGKDKFIRQLLYCWAKDTENQYLVAYKSMLALANTWKIPQFPVKGQDLLGLGIKEGKRVGELLEKTFDVWEEGGYKLSKAKLLTMIRKDIIK